MPTRWVIKCTECGNTKTQDHPASEDEDWTCDRKHGKVKQ
ncbi:hypothetical protein SEA_KINGBOB_58 [Arthrobacter phage KingBob]|uniref:Uncharacterized protein n=1 Tax=Arthrobacter phage Sergei TaxID=2250416 RepID=A0A345KPZ6_9CAUD|nr:hypothetical protein KDJ06_gp58 [Arthrobacter phage Sergei]ASZ74372.1 hypothetical protein TEMPER16_58 [Arthrobacter phage Temper16]AXH43985.1 hypothetical protein SEA_DAIBOJU_58 [Arthrobacter phage Daiboju]AXH44047.1 hypothetical protein SEA_HERB_58 [Arthrobacter phage Herb]AXH44291.1 hypothetical protein SEA_KINGBOB_58 [Arthrobacter phage KingBob]QGJ97198.1 hypothetical protein SEA_MARIA1952_57 [Arthrobacter phage Maria1952]